MQTHRQIDRQHFDQLITGSVVVLHCFKAHARINRKIKNSTPGKTKTSEYFSSKHCTYNYVGDDNNCVNFGAKWFSGGFSPSSAVSYVIKWLP